MALAAAVWTTYVKIAAWRGTRATVRGYRAGSHLYQHLDKEYSRVAKARRSLSLSGIQRLSTRKQK